MGVITRVDELTSQAFDSAKSVSTKLAEILTEDPWGSQDLSSEQRMKLTEALVHSEQIKLLLKEL